MESGNNSDSLRNRIYAYAGQHLNTCELDQSVILSEEADFELDRTTKIATLTLEALGPSPDALCARL